MTVPQWKIMFQLLRGLIIQTITRLELLLVEALSESFVFELIRMIFVLLYACAGIALIF